MKKVHGEQMTREEPLNYLDQLQSYRSVGCCPVATATPIWR
jgi:hypothetical protein